MTTQPPGLQTRSISARPASPPCPGAGRQRRARDHQVRASVGHGQVIEEAIAHLAVVPVIRARELLIQDLAQRRRRLDRHDLARAPDELQRQPARARSHLDDPVDVVRQPPEHAGVEPLGADQPVIELRFEPVEQLPGQGDVGSRVARAEPGRNRLASSSVSTPTSAAV